jgi:hypothetical protein
VSDAHGNETAPKGKVWVCCACGKLSRDLYGFKPISRGWDESCVLNAQMFEEKKLVIEQGRVVKVQK